MSITDKVFAFFGVPAATGHNKAIEDADKSMSANGHVVREAQQLEEAIRQLETTFGPTDGD